MFQSAEDVAAIAVLLAMIAVMEKKDLAGADASESRDETGGGLRLPIEGEAGPGGDAGGREFESGSAELRTAIAEWRAEPLHVILRVRSRGGL